MLSGLEMEMKRKPAFCWFPPSSSLCSQEQSGESTAADPGGAVDPVELAPQGRGQAHTLLPAVLQAALGSKALWALSSTLVPPFLTQSPGPHTSY